MAQYIHFSLKYFKGLLTGVVYIVAKFIRREPGTKHRCRNWGRGGGERGANILGRGAEPLLISSLVLVQYRLSKLIMSQSVNK